MKKLLALLLLLTLILTVPCSSLAQEENTRTFTDTVWDIPWRISTREFIRFAHENQNMIFAATDDPVILELQQPETFKFMDEPVQAARAYFVYMDFVSTGCYADTWKRRRFESSDSTYTTMVINFTPTVAEAHLEDWLEQFSRLLTRFHAQYGDPSWAAMSGLYLPEIIDTKYPLDLQTSRFWYALPLENGVLDQKHALELLNSQYDYFVLSASFHNMFITLRYEPLNFDAPYRIQFSAFYKHSVSDDGYDHFSERFPAYVPPAK